MPRSWLRRLFTGRSRATRPTHRVGPQPLLRLEDRITPAFNTTLSLAATTLGSVDVAMAAGTTTFTAKAAGANINIADIAAQLTAGNNVVVDSGSMGAEDGNITTTGFAMTSFTHLGNVTLTLQTGSGAGLVGNINITNLSSANPSRFVAKSNGDFSATGLGFLSMDLRSAKGSIQATGALIGTSLFAQAAKGIGTAGTPLPTQIGLLTANTTGNGAGIFIAESDVVKLANVNAVNGVVTNDGPIVISTTNGGIDTDTVTVDSGKAPITIRVGGLDQLFDNSAGQVLTINEAITITADHMALGNTADSIKSGNEPINLAPFTASRPIDLGAAADPDGTLNLSSDELNTLSTSDVVFVGNAATGDISFSAAIALPLNLTLTTGTGVSGTGDLTNGSASTKTFTIDQPGDSTYAGAIGGPAGGTANDKRIAFVKRGTGNLTLTGASNNSGANTIGAGTLTVNGSTGAGDVTVENGGTLAGTGTIGNVATTDVTVESGGALSPGDNGIGKLTVSDSVNFKGGSIFQVDIGTAAATDQLAADAVTINSGTKLIGVATAPLTAPFYPLILTTNLTVGAKGFQDVNGVDLPPTKGGPIEVGGKQFNYEYKFGASPAFKLTPIGTTIALDGGGNVIVTDAVDKDDTLTISRNGAMLRFFDPNNQLLAGAGVTQIDGNTVELPFANVTGKVQVDTGKGNDVVSLKLANGIIPAGGLDMDGGLGGSDLLTIVGSGVETANYTPSATTTGSGLVAVGGKNINFSNLEPLDISGMMLASVTLPSGADLVDVANGFDDATGAIPALVVTGTSGGVAFESAHLFDNVTVNIDTTSTDGADTVTITSADNAHKNVNLIINTGTGGDSLTVKGGMLAAGDIKLTSNALAIDADIKATGGDIVITANDTAAAGDNIAVKAATTIEATAGNATVQAGDDVVLNAGAIVKATAKSVFVTAGLADADAAGAIKAADATITAGADATLHATKTVALGTLSANAASGTARISAGGDVTQKGTVTSQSLGVRTAGAVTLESANAVDLFAAETTTAGKSIVFNTANALTISSVAANGLFFAATTGVKTVNADATMKSAKSIAINQAVTTGTATTRLSASGDVSQSAAGIITATALGVQNANGQIDLPQANSVSTFAADTSAAAGKSINFQSSKALTVDTVAKLVPLFVADVVGVITKSADITLQSGGATAIQMPISDSAGANTVRLVGAGNITQTAKVTSAALGVNNSAGAVTLTADNAVSTFAAKSPGSVSFKSAQALTIDTVAAAASLFTAPVAGVTSDNGNASIAGSNTLSVQQAVAATKGNVSFDTGDKISLAANVSAATSTGMVSLHATKNGVAQSAGAVNGNQLLLLGDDPGAFSLPSATNDVVTFAAAIEGVLQIRDANALTVGKVGATSGIKTENNFMTAQTGTAFSTMAGTTVDLGAANGNVQTGLNDVNNTNAVSNTDPSKNYRSQIQGSAITNGNGLNIFAGVASNGVDIAPNVSGIFFLLGGTPLPATVTPSSPGDQLGITNVKGPVIKLMNFDNVTGNGLFTFAKDKMSPPSATVQFFSFEQLVGLTAQVTAVQTGVNDYKIVARAVINGQEQDIGFTAPLPRTAPFLAAPSLTNPFAPFSAPYLSVADVNGDLTQDIIVGFSSNSGSPLVTVINGNTLTATGKETKVLADENILAQFFAYDPRFQGGIFVAAADFDGDGRAEIVTGPGQGQVPTDMGDGNFVKVFQFLKGPNPATPGKDFDKSNNIDLITRFRAFDAAFTGGARVAVGDVNGDFIPGKAPLHKPDIIVTSGPGGSPLVRIFNGQTIPLSNPANPLAEPAAAQFLAYDAGFKGGVFIDGGDYNNDGKADILTGAGYGGGPHIKVFDGFNAFQNLPPVVLDQFFDKLPPSGTVVDYQTALRAGVTSVGFGNHDGDDLIDIYVGSGLGVRNRVRIYDNIFGPNAKFVGPSRDINGEFNPSPGENRVDGAHVGISGTLLP